MESRNYTDITHLVNRAKKRGKTDNLWESSLRFIFFTAIFISFSLLLNFHLKTVTNKNASASSQVLSAARQAESKRLIIPQIDVNAHIEYVGTTPEGAMEVPSDSADVGWFKLGPRPGEKGSAVISGHVDSQDGEAAVFTNLYKLKKGDKLYVQDDKGTTTLFVVRELRTYDPGYADEVFSGGDGHHLNLVTCDGVWDGVKKSYSKRLVVFADIAR